MARAGMAPDFTSAAPAHTSVGVVLLIDRLEARTKLSQNRSAEDIEGVIDGLETDGEHAVSGAMRGLRGS